jgi:hypothetical protein
MAKKTDDRTMTADRELWYRTLQPIALAVFNAASNVMLSLKDVVLYTGDSKRFKKAAAADLCYIERRAGVMDQTEIFASPYIPDYDTGLAVLVAGMFLHFDEGSARGNIATAQRGQGKDLQLTALAEFLVKAGFNGTEHADGSHTWKLECANPDNDRAAIVADLAAAAAAHEAEHGPWPKPRPRPADEEKPARDRRIELVCDAGCDKKVRHRAEPMPIGCFIYEAQKADWKGHKCPRPKCDGTLIPKAKAKKAAADTLADKATKAKKTATKKAS